ncbi:MAG TPA: transposase [bacterium]|nr:transposase [bacterium]
MGRPLRLQAPRLHYYLVSECNSPEFRFETEEDFSIYLDLLARIRSRHGLRVFHYVLLPNAAHLFLKPGPRAPIARTMQWLNWQYALLHNRRKGKRGRFWLRRYRSAAVEPGAPALELMAEMDRAPLREGLADRPSAWKWSAHSALALGADNPLLDPHSAYLGLAEDLEARRQNYRSLVLSDGIPMGAESRPDPYRRFIGSAAFGRKITGRQKKMAS